MSISSKIKQRLRDTGTRYWAGDNISQHIQEGEHHQLIEELTGKFESVLDSLIIDRKTDPNSQDTGRRLAKMYVDELMQGRYFPMPNATAFPNHVEDGYDGMLVVRSELKKCVFTSSSTCHRCCVHWHYCGRYSDWTQQIHSYCSMVCKKRHTARRTVQRHCQRNHESYRIKKCWCIHSSHTWLL